MWHCAWCGEMTLAFYDFLPWSLLCDDCMDVLAESQWVIVRLLEE
jgi:hypothetical protein